jgi:hypothetical protein
MPLELGQVVHRIRPTEQAGVDQAHVQIPDECHALRFVEETQAVEKPAFPAPGTIVGRKGLM